MPHSSVKRVDLTKAVCGIIILTPRIYISKFFWNIFRGKLEYDRTGISFRVISDPILSCYILIMSIDPLKTSIKIYINAEKPWSKIQ